MKAMVDADTCTGCELCTTVAPDVFEMDGDVAKSVGDVPAGSEDSAKEAAESCPVEAISLS
ncbi:MAG TPA: ferredoxin [Spirochaetia bacterium]|nr:ferredoxin [Spirochaetia bacterium]